MSTKKAHLYNMAWMHLDVLVNETGRPVSAGEFARYMGIARSTALRWLEEMRQEHAVKQNEKQHGKMIVTSWETRRSHVE